MPDHRLLRGALLPGDQRLQPLQPLGLDLLGHLRSFGGGGAGPRGILEGKGVAVFNRLHQVERGLEIRVRFLGKADDEIPRHQDVGPGRADAVDQAQVFLGGVAPVHALENAVAARLHGQMEIGHQLFAFAMGGDQVVAHVVRMRGGEADPRQPLDPFEFPDEPRERPVRSPGPSP